MAGPEPPPDATRILVVDDEVAIAELIATTLRYEGYAAHVALTGRAGLDALETFRPELVILDVRLPDIDGFEIQRRLRSDGYRTRVLFLTARDATADKVRGLTLGGDDYVTKPFSIDELLARIRALLRRSGLDSRQPSRIRVGDLDLDEDAHVVFRNDEAIDLSPTEFNLLRFLMINCGRVLSKAQILDHVWEYDFGGAETTTVVETYMSYLRKKLAAGGRAPLIHTIRGVGYTLRAPRESGQRL